MSQTSHHLSLPYIQGGQAQKHVTHNEAIRALDRLVHLSVKARQLIPNVAAAEGDRFIVSPNAIGDFAGHDNEIAIRESGSWVFMTPQTGFLAYDEDTGAQFLFDGADWLTAGTMTYTDMLGVNTAADGHNRLTSSAEATLLTHDAGGGHQLKVNKATESDTASLLFQTGWSARAEMGTTGSDDFEIKVSEDGLTFATALRVTAATGGVSLPNTQLSNPEFGQAALVTQDYVASRASNLVTNGALHLGNDYNYPAPLTFDPTQSPNLAGAVTMSGYYAGAVEMEEHIAVDPNRLYRLSSYLRQESVAGDFSAFAHEDRQAHSLGLRCYDADGLPIEAAHHARYRHAGTDSLTTLTQPLAPGDIVVHVVNASGWNETDGGSEDRGLTIFEYRSGTGRVYEYYSRLTDEDLFDLGDVNKTTNQITLNKPFPAGLGNPDDSGGVWPAGTKLANRASGWGYKFGFFDNFVPAATQTWYRIDNAIGGVDASGRNLPNNFPPGTATVRPVLLLNYTNRSGGYSGFPDTGTGQTVWLSGIAMNADQSGAVLQVSDGSCDLRIVQGDPLSGAVDFTASTQKVTEI